MYGSHACLYKLSDVMNVFSTTRISLSLSLSLSPTLSLSLLSYASLHDTLPSPHSLLLFSSPRPHRYIYSNPSLSYLAAETIEVGQENKIIKREAELEVIERAFKASKRSLREAVKEVDGFLMCENDKKEAVLKLKLKVRLEIEE
jgi:hypothetical protein